jgi:hypothetical protein
MTPALPNKDSQKFTATINLTWDAELFPGDPDDMFEIADLEKEALYDGLRGALGSSFDIQIRKVVPVYS